MKKIQQHEICSNLLLASFIANIILQGICSPVPRAPFFDKQSTMGIKYQSSLDKDSTFCTRTCTGRGHELGHRMHLVCRTRRVETTKLFDLDNDVFYELNGYTGTWNWKMPVPQSEKNDPLFLMSFCVDGKSNITQLEERIRSLEERKVLHVEREELETHVNVFLKQGTYPCTMITTVTRRTGASKYCEDPPQKPAYCPCVPLASSVSCEDGNIIRFSFDGYTKEINRSVVQLPANFDNVTTAEPNETEESPLRDLLHPSYSESTVTGLFVGIAFLFAVAIALVVVILKQRRQLAAGEERLHHPQDNEQNLL